MTLFKGIISLRVPRFPILHVIAVFLLSLTPLLSIASFLLVSTGFLTSWTYLRFYKPAFPDLDSAQSASLRGDASETFAFAEFFPDAVKPVISSFSNSIFNILVAFKICTPFSAADVSASRGDTSSLQSQQRSTPGGARAEAERRRALALKALDQRLHAATSKGMGTSIPQPAPAIHTPPVQAQPQPSSQTMAPMLGETSYTPEREGEKGDH